MVRSARTARQGKAKNKAGAKAKPKAKPATKKAPTTRGSKEPPPKATKSIKKDEPVDSETEPESNSENENETLTPADRTIAKPRTARKSTSAAPARRGRSSVSLQSTARTIDFDDDDEAGPSKLPAAQPRASSGSDTDVDTPPKTSKRVAAAKKSPAKKPPAKKGASKAAPVLSDIIEGEEENSEEEEEESPKASAKKRKAAPSLSDSEYDEDVVPKTPAKKTPKKAPSTSRSSRRAKGQTYEELDTDIEDGSEAEDFAPSQRGHGEDDVSSYAQTPTPRKSNAKRTKAKAGDAPLSPFRTVNNFKSKAKATEWEEKDDWRDSSVLDY